jgi:hypothetical protein
MTKLWDIVKTVGSGIIREAVPGGGLIVQAVNAFLPDEQKLPDTATGADIGQAVATLPADQRSAVMQKEFDVDITQIKESNSTVRAMLEHDTANPHSTRPKIALGAFNLVAFVTLVIVSMWAYGILAGKADIISAVSEGWPFVLTTIGPFVTLLLAYFGVLRNEHKQKMNAAVGNSSGGIAGLISLLTKKG